MNLTPEKFIEFIALGNSEESANRKESDYIDQSKLRELIRKYDHTEESATNYLLTDYSNGFTICKNCGTFYQLGNGFLKHISKGCLHCEGSEKHRVYYHSGNNEKDYKTPARWMAVYFDNGLHYCRDKAEIEKYKSLIEANFNANTNL